MRLTLLAPLALLLIVACDDGDASEDPAVYLDAPATTADAATPTPDGEAPAQDAAPATPDAGEVTPDAAPVEPDAAPVEPDAFVEPSWLEAFAQARVEIECEKYDACLDPAARALDTTTLCTPTQRARRARDIVWMAETWAGEGKWTQHQEHADACLEALRDRPCHLLEHGEPPACRALFAGTQAPGARCLLDDVCADEGFCDIIDPCFGECQPRRAAGEACLSARDCAWGLACVLGACADPQPEGGACLWSNACGEGLFCLATGSGEGECTPRAQQYTQEIGQGCSLSGDTRTCRDGLACVLGEDAEGECVALGSQGGRCVIGRPNPCADGLYCKFGDDIYNGRCEPIPAVGQRCVPDEFSEPCGYEASCIDGTCKAHLGYGAPCSVDEECASFDCVSGRCDYGFACD